MIWKANKTVYGFPGRVFVTDMQDPHPSFPLQIVFLRQTSDQLHASLQWTAWPIYFEGTSQQNQFILIENFLVHS